MVMLVILAFSVLVTLQTVSPSNLCSTAGLCCKHRDSECVAQKVFPNHTVDTSQLPCYCDHACIRLDDCCSDYKHFCAVHDCKLSEWGPWSPCSVRCGAGGFTERHRVILHQASNGGAGCPHLVQAKPCSGRACDEDEPEERWTEGLSSTMSTMPSLTSQKSTDNGTGIDESTKAVASKAASKGASMTASTVASMASRQEVFHTLVASHESHHPLQLNKESSCMEMVIIRATIGCQHHDSRLHIGTRICVDCPQYKTTKSKSSRLFSPNDQEILEQEVNCAELTQTPIRKFRLSAHCHGKLTFLAPDPASKCSCSKGLHFRLIPEEVPTDDSTI